MVAEGFDYEIIEKMYAPHDNLGIAVTLKADGTIDKKVVGSVAEALPLDSENDMAFGRLNGNFSMIRCRWRHSQSLRRGIV